jgi:phosphate starvation-inducible PhoH-like protein
VNPYLRPLYDALNDMVDFDRARKLIERGTIEVAPLAFMRGRTLNDSFVILDEAQNTTSEQMKMFLTRLGYGSKAVVTGDVTQIDLPGGQAVGPQGGAGSVAGHRRHPDRHVHRARRRAPPARAGDHRRVRPLGALRAVPVLVAMRGRRVPALARRLARRARRMLDVLGLGSAELSLVLVSDR